MTDNNSNAYKASSHIATCTYMCSFKYEWTLYTNACEILWNISGNDLANPKTQSLFATSRHFQNMPPHGRTTFLYVKVYIRFQTFTNENIAIPISAFHRQVLVRSRVEEK